MRERTAKSVGPKPRKYFWELYDSTGFEKRSKGKFVFRLFTSLRGEGESGRGSSPQNPFLQTGSRGNLLDCASKGVSVALLK